VNNNNNNNNNNKNYNWADLKDVFVLDNSLIIIFHFHRFMFNVGVFSINADITVGAKERVLWTVIIFLIMYSTRSLSLILTGLIIGQVGFFIPIVLIASCISLAAIFAIFFLPETFPEPQKKKLECSSKSEKAN